nr:Chain C, RPP peptide from EBV [Epstein-barr virus strain ag876]6VMX_C Chain C, Epstein-Barr nuclear antigen 3 [Human herpesvirus 4 strain B95-8]6VMX_H Chain H, Epstein-Barr nuclear antigen 3 [Human herpesvirus 4 strain B95-8]
RPPIFIRRL